MSAFSRLMLSLAGTNAALAIALGAFGAHALKPRLLEIFYTAVLCHFVLCSTRWVLPWSGSRH